MAKDIAQAIVQATNNKGVAGWSLKTDDNATVDPTINWQEGQAPSTVNNSARAMMTRIREEHDLIDSRVKVIENRWGSSFLYVEINSFTLKDNNGSPFDLNMIISNKLTDEQYADFKTGKLGLAVNWGNGIVNDPVYKSITTQDVIKLSLSIPTASTTHLWKPNISLSFFGRRSDNNHITLHELSYISSNLMEYVAEKTDPPTNMMRTVRSIPMHRSYVGWIEAGIEDRYGQEITVKISWYYISPSEIILTVEPTGPNGSSYFNDFTYDLGVGWDNLTFLDNTTRQGVANVLKASPMSFLMASYVANGGYYTVNLPDKWDGVKYRFHAKLTTDAHFKRYNMVVRPQEGLTYPIIA